MKSEPDARDYAPVFPSTTRENLGHPRLLGPSIVTGMTAWPNIDGWAPHPELPLLAGSRHSSPFRPTLISSVTIPHIEVCSGRSNEGAGDRGTDSGSRATATAM